MKNMEIFHLLRKNLAFMGRIFSALFSCLAVFGDDLNAVYNEFVTYLPLSK